MRYATIVLGLTIAGCAGTPADTARLPERCASAECFRPRDVRAMEALDDETLIVYAGSRECAFRVELRGIGCRLAFAMDVNFVQREPGSGSVTTNRPVRYESPSRVCAYTPRLEIFTGIYDPASGQTVGGGGADPFDGGCRVVNVDALTDDELVELYVERGRTAPPPPMGGGSLETPEQQEAESGQADEAGQEQGGDTAEAAQGAETGDAEAGAR